MGDVAGKLIINDSDLAVEKCHMLFFFLFFFSLCTMQMMVEVGEGRHPAPPPRRLTAVGMTGASAASATWTVSPSSGETPWS